MMFTMNYIEMINRFSILIFLLFTISCSVSDDSENNIESSVFSFYDELDEGNSFPKMIISTNGQEIIDEPKINADLKVIEENSEINYKIGIETRGSSSQMFPKKSYGFETRSSDWSDDIDVELGGFPEEEDWILYGPYSDKSLIRNKLTFDLSNSIGYYASRTKFYNLFINNESKGLYVLMEKIKRDKNRVDISKLGDDTVNGGYIIKIDKPTGDGESCSTCYDSSFSFRSSYNTKGEISNESEIYFIYHYPKPDEKSEDQKDYIKSVIYDFETALISANSQNLIDIIDIDSFVDFFIINELIKNPDGYRLSTFLNKDFEGKLKMGPIWDFNLAFANVDYCDGSNPEGWIYNFNNICPGDVWQVPFWWTNLMQNEVFKSALKIRWEALRSSKLSNSEIFGKINSYKDYLESNKVINQNFYIWPVLGQYVWPNYFVGSSHQEEIDFMKNWITDRLSWMDNQISAIN